MTGVAVWRPRTKLRCGNESPVTTRSTPYPLPGQYTTPSHYSRSLSLRRGFRRFPGSLMRRLADRARFIILRDRESVSPSRDVSRKRNVPHVHALRRRADDLIRGIIRDHCPPRGIRTATTSREPLLLRSEDLQAGIHLSRALKIRLLCISCPRACSSHRYFP